MPLAEDRVVGRGAAVDAGLGGELLSRLRLLAIWAIAPKASPARSFISVVIATVQPLPTPPTTFASGIRASSMKTSLNSPSPVIWTSGLASTPSCSMSIRK